MKKQVFLGGSCNPTDWRLKLSIPALEKAGVAYYNPQIDDWSAKDAEFKAAGIPGGITQVEAEEKDASQELLFVIDGQTRAMASILEATENIVRGRSVTLVINNITDQTVISGQTVTGGELKDLNRLRSYLKDVVGRYPHNVKVFDTVEDATNHVIDKLK